MRKRSPESVPGTYHGLRPQQRSPYNSSEHDATKNLQICVFPIKNSMAAPGGVSAASAASESSVQGAAAHVDLHLAAGIRDMAAHMAAVTAGRTSTPTDFPTPSTVIVPEAFELSKVPKVDKQRPGTLYHFVSAKLIKGAPRITMHQTFRINDVVFDESPLPTSFPATMAVIKPDGSIPDEAWTPRTTLTLRARLFPDRHAADIAALQALDYHVTKLVFERRNELVPGMAPLWSTPESVSGVYDRILKQDTDGTFFIDLEIFGWGETITGALQAPSGGRVQSCSFQTVRADWTPHTSIILAAERPGGPPITTFKVAIPDMNRSAVTAVVPRTATGDLLRPSPIIKENGSPVMLKVSPAA